jgi:hypothetical protein
VLNRVITKHRLTFITRAGGQAYLSYFRKDEQVAVRLAPSPWHLFIGQLLRAVALPRSEGYVLKTQRYEYRIQLKESIAEEAVVRFEYVSDEAEPTFQYCRNHIQFHKDYHDLRRDFSPAKLHIPSGWVTIENVVRFLLTELAAKPLRRDWREVLARSEEQFTMDGRSVPERRGQVERAQS